MTNKYKRREEKKREEKRREEERREEIESERERGVVLCLSLLPSVVMLQHNNITYTHTHEYIHVCNVRLTRSQQKKPNSVSAP